MQHLANDLIESGHSESKAIEMAVGIIRAWSQGRPTGGMKKVEESTQSAAKKAIAEWEALKAKAKSVKSVPGLSISEQVGIELAHQPGSTVVASSGDGPRVTKNTLAGGKRTKYGTGQRRKWADQGVALPDGSFPIPDKAHVRKAAMAIGRAPASKRPAVRAHIRKRAKALGVKAPLLGG
jgi:uncharacterized protein YdaT